MHRRTSTCIAVAALLFVPAGAAGAVGTVTSEAEAVSIDVNDGTLVVSGTRASTGGQGDADATVVGLFGETIVGGSQTGSGGANGELLGTGRTVVGELRVAPWEGTVDDRSARASSSVLSIALIDERTATAELLRSESEATDGGSRSSTTGAVADLGGGQLRLELLRVSSSSDGSGEVYVLGIGDQRLLSSDQIGDRCELGLIALVHLICLRATAAEDTSGVTDGALAELLDVAVLGDLVHGDVMRTGAKQRIETVLDLPPEGHAPPAAHDPAEIAVLPSADAANRSPLPTTGLDLHLAFAAFAAIAVGVALRRATERVRSR